MPDDGSKLRDVAILADEGAEVSFEIPLSRMARLVGELAAPAGMASGIVRFSRQRGFPVAEVQVAADVTVVCQRCLKPMVAHLGAGSRVFLPTSEAAVERVPDDAELMLAPEGRLRLGELVEEDLLLALPFAPLHDEESDCAERGDETARTEAPAAEEVQRPFAALGDLMGRAKRDGPKRS
ncbi:MAG: hypothetical protein RLZZ393_1780 [Pseudomonadota bacterium]